MINEFVDPCGEEGEHNSSENEEYESHTYYDPWNKRK